MRISELARRTGVTTKAVRYYEQLGLLSPSRSTNGYRQYTEDHVRVVAEIDELSTYGIPPSKAQPFVECLDAGHRHSDDCASSLAAYRDSIAELDRVIASLTVRRDALQTRLEESANRSFSLENSMADYSNLPAGLPVPADDGAADHLAGMKMPSLALPGTDGAPVRLDSLGSGRTVIYIYPLTGRPGTDLPEGWDSIPGARGCTPETCGFRDHYRELLTAGATGVFGLSSQDSGYQREVVERLHLPFQMLSDTDFDLAEALKLPTFAASDHPRLYARLTLIIRDNAVEHVFYPIFPPNEHAEQVLSWLESNPL